jgi:zinc-ribbon domain
VSGALLVCPACDTPAAADERFCPACGMPLVFAELQTGPEPEVTERQIRARKVKKQYLEGPLVRVAVARHQAEAELIQGLLLEHGVPSMAKRSGGFDVPDMLFSGPRDILVPGAGEATAREVLGTAEREHAAAGERAIAAGERPARRRAARSTRTLAVVVSTSLAVFSLGPLIVLIAHH